MVNLSYLNKNPELLTHVKPGGLHKNIKCIELQMSSSKLNSLSSYVACEACMKLCEVGIMHFYLQRQSFYLGSCSHGRCFLLLEETIDWLCRLTEIYTSEK